MESRDKRRDRFKRLATLRTKNVLRAMRVLGNCSNQNAYEYTQKEIDAIFAAIEKQLKKVKAHFHSETDENIDFSL